MKKIALAIAVSALATSVAVAEGNSNFSGFYAGANVGYGATSTKVNYSATASGDVAGKGVIGGLHVGYGKQFANNFYAGLEATGSLSGNKGEDRTSATQRFETKRTNSFGIHVRPGVVVGNTLIAAKIGVESAHLKASFTDSATPANNRSKNSRRTGFVVGAGFDTKVSDHVVVGLGATQTFYSSFAYAQNTRVKAQATDVVARISYLW